MKLFKSYKEGFKDGEQLRDFVYVKDVVDAMISLIHYEHQGPCGIYNLGTGKARSFLDLVNATFKAMGMTPSIEFIEMPDNLKEQYQYFTEANMAKFSKTLSHLKFHDLEEGVFDYVTNHLMQKNQYLVKDFKHAKD